MSAEPGGPGPSGQEARRLAASHWRRSLRRSSSEVPPQIPESWFDGEGEVEARGLGITLAAHGLGRLDLVDGGAGRADGEEEVGIGVAARGYGAPVVVIFGFDGERLSSGVGQRSNRSEGHSASTRSGFTSWPIVKLFTCHRAAK